MTAASTRHRRIEDLLARHNVPGVSLAVVADGQRAFTHAYGLHDRERAVPMTRDSAFRAGSLTKLLTAIVALQLAEHKQLTLSDPVVDHVPELSIDSPFPPTEITLGHLLSHASGLPRGPYSQEPLSPVVRLRQLAGMRLAYPPATARKYSNLGFAIAGQALSQAGGAPYAELVRRQVLAPLGLERSGIADGAESAANLATGYQRDHYRSLVRRDDALRPAPAISVDEAAGGLWTTADDFALLLAALLRTNTGILSADAWARMTAPQPPPTPARPYGLGLHLGQRFGQPCLWHAGGTAGFFGLMVAFPDQGVGGIALCNRCSAWYPLNEILNLLLAPLLGARYPRRDPTAGWSRYVGRYDSPGGPIEVLRSGARLMLRHGSETVALRAHGRHRFIQEGGPWSDHLLRFIVQQARAAGCVAGPWRWVRAGRFAPLFWAEIDDHGQPKPAPPAGYSRYPGTYNHPAIGDVRVYLRGGKLRFSFYYAEETVLEPVTGHAFRARRGVFAGEPVVFHLEGAEAVALDAGYMRFRRQLERQASG